jgi:hypothetical protein
MTINIILSYLVISGAVLAIVLTIKFFELLDRLLT